MSTTPSVPSGTNAQPEAVVTERTGQAPVVVRPLPWWIIILVRASRAGLSAFLGTQGISAVLPSGLPAGSSVIIAFKIAMGAAIWSALQNALELLAKVDQSAPALRA